MADKKVLIICVDYQSEDETISYVSDLRSQSISEVIDIVVVCNSGIEKLVNELSKYTDIHLYDFHKNMGYFPAANAGLQEYLKEHKLPPLVIVSNTDIRIRQNVFFEKLLALPYDYDVLAPSIINTEGYNQNPFIMNRLTKKKLNILLGIFKCYPLFCLYSYLSRVKASLKKPIKNKSDYNLRPEVIYAPHGSFIIFSKSYFSKGGDLMHECFLYGEELYIAESGIKYSMNVLFEKSLCVEHLEHVTTSLMGSRNKANYLHAATSYIVNRFYGEGN